MWDPSPVLTFFKGEHYSGHPPECLSLLQFIIQIKRRSSGCKSNEQDLCVMLTCLKFHLTWGDFSPNLYISKKTVSFMESEFFQDSKHYIEIWVVCQKFAESSLCHAFSLLISKHFMKRRVGNQCYVFWVRNRMVFYPQSENSGAHTPRLSPHPLL